MDSASKQELQLEDLVAPQCFFHMLVCQVPVSESIHSELLNRIKNVLGLLTSLSIVDILSS